MYFCLHSLTNSNVARVFLRVSRLRSGVVFSMEWFPTGLSRIPSLPVWTPSQGAPPSTLTPANHYLTHPPLYHVRGPCAPPSMCFCLHSVTDGDKGLEFSRVFALRVGSCPLHRRGSHRVSLDDITSCLEPPANVPHSRRRPPSTIIRSTHHCTIYMGDTPTCAYVYIRLPMVTKAGSLHWLAVSDRELSPPQKGFPPGSPG